jgi:hypothetical protein
MWDARNVVDRVRSNHCSGNVEGSALRKHVAEHKGYRLAVAKRANGTPKVRLDLPYPREGEKEISSYIRSGKWRYCLCDSTTEATDFQWYVIEKVNPLLNVERRSWNENSGPKYEGLLRKLVTSRHFTCDELKIEPTGPGVYVLYHNVRPM